MWTPVDVYPRRLVFSSPLPLHPTTAMALELKNDSGLGTSDGPPLPSPRTAASLGTRRLVLITVRPGALRAIVDAEMWRKRAGVCGGCQGAARHRRQTSNSSGGTPDGSLEGCHDGSPAGPPRCPLTIVPDYGGRIYLARGLTRFLVDVSLENYRLKLFSGKDGDSYLSTSVKGTYITFLLVNKRQNNYTLSRNS
jgi:hypothetical protein